MSPSTMTRNKNAGRQLVDYDLNIFQEEMLNDDGDYEHIGPWHIHIYVCENNGHQELGVPIELTHDEYLDLIKYDPYFKDEVDTWYGLDGFRRDKWEAMSDRLKAIFDGLPKYKD